MTIPIPKQPWLWVRFRITTILLVIAILAILLTWRRDHQQMASELMRLRYPGPHYEAAQATDSGVRDYFRLFMMPGVLHCAGGPGPDNADWTTALVDWSNRARRPIASWRERRPRAAPPRARGRSVRIPSTPPIPALAP